MNEPLFEKYVRNELSSQEVRELSILLEREEGKREFVAFLQEWSLLGSVARQMEAAQPAKRTRARGPQATRRPAKVLWLAGLAAAILIAIGVLWIMSGETTDPSGPSDPSPMAVQPRDPKPPPHEKRDEPEKQPVPDPAPPVPEPVPESESPPPPDKPKSPPSDPPPSVEPPPTPPPPPPPAPEPKPVPPRPSDSVVAVAEIKKVEGEAFIKKGSGRIPATPGAPIVAGDVLETTKGRLTAKYADGTSIELEPGTRLEGLEGKKPLLTAGTLIADVKPQPAGHPIIFRTANAEAIVVGTRLTLTVSPGRTLLQVLEGKVRLKRADGRKILVSKGQEGEVAKGVVFRTRRLVLTRVFQDGVDGYTGTRDTMICEKEPNRVFGREDKLEVDGEQEDSERVTSLLRWDLSSIPRESQVRAVSLTIHVEESSEWNAYRLYPAMRPWSEESTWLVSSPGRPWGKPGALSTTDRAAKVTLGTLAPANKGPLTVILNEAGLTVVQAWIRNPARNHGLMIVNDRDTDNFKLYSRERKNSHERPKLKVSFAAPRR